jgi:hypothetical protein
VSTFRDPPRILRSSEAVPSLVREGLEAELLDEGPDASHIERLAARLPAAEGNVATTKTGSWFSWPRVVTLAGVGILGAAGFAAEIHSESEPGTSLTASAPPASTLHAMPIEPNASAEPHAVRPDELPTAIPTGAQPPPAAHNSPPAPRPARAAASNAPARPAASEGAEIDLLARAHEALRARPAETLALCQKHQAEFANGRFTQEREALAIEALLYLRRRGEAERRWSEFQQRYPASNHRTHLADLFSSPSL